MGDQADFATKFHNLDGDLKGERTKNLFKLLKTTVFENEQQLDSALRSLKPKSYQENLFYIETLIYFKRSNELLEVLKGGNEVHISKILKQAWCFQNIFDNVEPEAFVTEFLPHVSYAVKKKFLNRISNHWTEKKIDSLFEALLKKYGIPMAVSVLHKCSPTKIQAAIVELDLQLNSNQVLNIYNKSEELFIFYVNLKQYYNDEKVLKNIAIKNPELVLKLHRERKIRLYRVGRRTSKNIFNMVNDDVLKDSEYYLKFLNNAVVVRKLGKHFDTLFKDLFPNQLNSVSTYCKSCQLISYYPKNRRWNLLNQTFTEKFNGRELKDLLLNFNSMTSLNPPKEIVELWAEVHYKEQQGNYNNFLKYYPPAKAIPALKEKINVTSDLWERQSLVLLLIETCKNSEDLDALVEVLKYICFSNGDFMEKHLEYLVKNGKDYKPLLIQYLKDMAIERRIRDFRNIDLSISKRLYTEMENLMGDQVDFVTKFHNLDGDLKGERTKNLFKLLKTAVFENEEQLDTALRSLKPKSYQENLFYIETLIYFKRSNQLLEVLRGGNDVYISKILKQAWFFQNVFDNVEPEAFVTEFLPHVSYAVKKTFLNRISNHWNEQKVDSLFEALLKKYGLPLAVSVLHKCSPTKIQTAIVEHDLELNSNQVLNIYNKSEELFIFYVDFKQKNYNDWKVLKNIAIKNPELVLKLQREQKISLYRVGRRTSKKMFNIVNDDVLKDSEYYLEFLKNAVVVRKLGKNFDTLFKNLFPNQLNRVIYCKSCTLINYYPKNKRWNLLHQTFIEKFSGQELKDLLLVFHSMIQLNPPREIVELWAEAHYKKGNEGNNHFLKYYPPSKAIPALKEKINVTSDLQARLSLDYLMGDHVDFATRFHNLDGDLKGERSKSLFNLLKTTVFENDSQLDSALKSLKPKSYQENLFYIDTLIYFKRSNDLIEILKGGNDVHISKILKQTWFFQNIFNDVEAEIFVSEFLPHLSYGVKKKFLKRISNHWNEQKIDSLFEALQKKFGTQGLLTGSKIQGKVADLNENHWKYIDEQIHILRVQKKLYLKENGDFIEKHLEYLVQNGKDYKSLLTDYFKDMVKEGRRDSANTPGHGAARRRSQNSRKGAVVRSVYTISSRDYGYKDLSLRKRLYIDMIEILDDVVNGVKSDRDSKQCKLDFLQTILKFCQENPEYCIKIADFPVLVQLIHESFSTNCRDDNEIIANVILYNAKFPQYAVECDTDVFQLMREYIDENKSLGSFRRMFSKILFTKDRDDFANKLLKFYCENYFEGFPDVSIVGWFLQNEPKVLSPYMSIVALNYNRYLSFPTYKLLKQYSHLGYDKAVSDSIIARFDSCKVDSIKLRPSHLSILLSTDDFVTFVSERYLPKKDKLDLMDDEMREIYKAQCEVAKQLANVDEPYKMLPTIMIFCKGDYLQSALPSLQKAFYRSPERVLYSYVKAMSKQAVSVRKHAIFFSCEILDKQHTLQVLTNTKESNVSSLKYLFSATLKYFLKNPSEELLDKVIESMNNIDINDKQTLDSLKSVTVPVKYRAQYIEKCWKYFESLKSKGVKVTEYLNSFLSPFYMTADILSILSGTFITNIIKSYFPAGEERLDDIDEFVVRVLQTRVGERNGNFQIVFHMLSKFSNTTRTLFFKTFIDYIHARPDQQLLLVTMFAESWHKNFSLIDSFDEHIILKLISFKSENSSVDDLAAKTVNYLEQLITEFGPHSFDHFNEQFKTAFSYIYLVEEYTFYLAILKYKATPTTCALVLNNVINLSDDDDEKLRNTFNDIINIIKNVDTPIVRINLKSFLVDHQVNQIVTKKRKGAKRLRRR
uniref:Uncharacterized protein LOC114335577 n=1 Tax=Diabrotica virgifera virgifera TaxID=50390 RepID=A0A6P7G3M4_DIAVI